MQALWDELRGSDLVKIENAAYWNMASKRMEAQARWGDIPVPIGGTEGVRFLANLYHDAGRPVVPVNLAICPQNTGARRLFESGLASNHAGVCSRPPVVSTTMAGSTASISRPASQFPSG